MKERQRDINMLSLRGNHSEEQRDVNKLTPKGKSCCSIKRIINAIFIVHF